MNTIEGQVHQSHLVVQLRCHFHVDCVHCKTGIPWTMFAFDILLLSGSSVVHISSKNHLFSALRM